MEQKYKNIIYYELPSVGEVFQKGDAIGVIETELSLEDVLMPVSGSITKIEVKNDTLILEVDPIH